MLPLGSDCAQLAKRRIARSPVDFFKQAASRTAAIFDSSSPVHASGAFHRP
jgi:hypothetical protein